MFFYPLIELKKKKTLKINFSYSLTFKKGRVSPILPSKPKGYFFCIGHVGSQQLPPHRQHGRKPEVAGPNEPNTRPSDGERQLVGLGCTSVARWRKLGGGEIWVLRWQESEHVLKEWWLKFGFKGKQEEEKQQQYQTVKTLIPTKRS